MPQVNLTTLKGPELRRLLDATRARGDASMSYKILQEMAARREGHAGRGLSARRRPAEPRVIAVDLGDPMERQDDVPPLPAWRAPPSKPEASASPAAEPEPVPVPAPRRSRRRKTQQSPIAAPAAAAPVAEVDIEPTPPLEPKRPRSVWDDDPEPTEDRPVNSKGWSLRFRAPDLESSQASRTRRGGPGAGFAVGIAVGAALGWWVAGTTREAPSPPIAPAAPIRTAALAPRPLPATTPVAATAAEPEPAAPETQPDPAAGPPPSDVREDPLLSPDASEVAHEATGEAMELPAPLPERRKAEAVRTIETPRTALAQAAPAGTNACAAEPTPADREICSDPDLRRLQRELRQAYAQALEAHQDRELLRQRQLAWRDARNSVSEPDRLAQLYEQRIRKLNAATAAARQQR